MPHPMFSDASPKHVVVGIRFHELMLHQSSLLLTDTRTACVHLPYLPAYSLSFRTMLVE